MSSKGKSNHAKKREKAKEKNINIFSAQKK